MTTALDFLNLDQLIEREKHLERELKKIRKEIAIRKKSGNFNGDGWDSIEVLKKKIEPMILPTEIEHQDDIDEKNITKLTNQTTKSLVKMVKNKIQLNLLEPTTNNSSINTNLEQTSNNDILETIVQRNNSDNIPVCISLKKNKKNYKDINPDLNNIWN